MGVYLYFFQVDSDLEVNFPSDVPGANESSFCKHSQSAAFWLLIDMHCQFNLIQDFLYESSYDTYVVQNIYSWTPLYHLNPWIL